MKTLLLASALSLFSVESFAQIDDVINKPRVGPTQAGKVFRMLATRFDHVSISSLVDDMRRDGISERKFYGTFGVDGRLINIHTDRVTNSKLELIPFTVKVTSDKKVYVATALIDLQDFSPEYIERAQFVVFRLDEGVEFRDIKKVGYSVGDLNFKIPIIHSENALFSFVGGVDLGFYTETIRLENGQIIEISHGNTESSADRAKPSQHLISGSLQLKKKMSEVGSLMINGMFKAYLLDGAAPVGDMELEHRRNMISSDITYTHKLKNNKKVSFGIGANYTIKDELIVNEKETIDLGNRSRQPVHATLKYNF